jgi:hypothetical protein
MAIKGSNSFCQAFISNFAVAAPMRELYHRALSNSMLTSLSYTESLRLNGFAVMRKFAVDLTSIDASRQLGEIDVVEGLDSVQTLVPHDCDEAQPNTYSGNFGRSAFPLHTDLAHWVRPPRYFVLRCICGAPNVATHLLDGQVLIDTFGTDTLRMALVQPRRPMRNGKQLLRLLERLDAPSRSLIRWDSLYLRPATSLAADILERIQTFLLRLQPAQVTLLEMGDTLVVDNWRCLHGRSAILNAGGLRRIDRTYLKELR